jgi:putative (di)nucleoside polyphosphate hydrolase
VSEAFFRANVGACIIDERGRVLALRRKGVPEIVWQMPQGGIETGEEPHQAVLREVKEETGLTQNDVEIVAEYPDWLVYELPRQYRNEKVGWGQAQRWFLLRARAGVTIRPDNVEVEAAAFLAPEDLLKSAVAFRLPTYRRVLQNFASFTVRKEAG